MIRQEDQKHIFNFVWSNNLITVYTNSTKYFVLMQNSSVIYRNRILQSPLKILVKMYHIALNFQGRRLL